MQKKDIFLLKRLLYNTIHFKKHFFLFFVSYIVITIIMFLRPVMTQILIDGGMIAKKVEVILGLSCVLLVSVILEQGIEIMQASLLVGIQNEVQEKISGNAFEKLLKLKTSYFSQENSAEIVNKLLTDIQFVSLTVDRNVMFLFSYILKAISGMIGLFIINWKLAGVVIIVLPIKLFCVRHFAKIKGRTTEEMITSSQELAGWMGENIDGIREIKLWNLYSWKNSVFAQKYKKILKINKQDQMTEAFNLSAEILLEWLLTVMLYVFGGMFVCKDLLSVGGLFAFITYGGYVTSPISAIFNLSFIFMSILPSAKRLSDFMEREEESSFAKKEVHSFEDNITIKNLTFSYGEEELFKDCNLVIKKGEKIAILGSNGSGKTTMVNLLLRFVEPIEGELLLDGVAINKYNLADYRSLFGVVCQENFLFKGSIKENIDLQNKSGDIEVSEACRICNMEEAISRFSQGYQSEVLREGKNFSDGERQKLALARALVKKSPIIILDEAITNYDTESYNHVYKKIKNELSEKTIIFITHQTQNLEEMDRVYCIAHGRMEEITDTEKLDISSN